MQLKSALIRYQLSRAYYPTAARMSQLELNVAARQEREAWSLLCETCQPLLADARQPCSPAPGTEPAC